MTERILVVEDEESMRDIISSMLIAAGYQLSMACSGNEALAVLDSGKEFELLISNLMMADGDGLSLLEKTRESFPDMPFVMETAVHNESVIEDAYRLGVYDYILKPFFREQLVTAVRRALECRRLKLENLAYQAKFPTDGLNGQGESGKQHILFVHDEEPFREMVHSMLTSAGYQCETATSGLAALALLNSGEAFDLVISGVMMPEGQGLFLLEQARESFPEIPFVMLTGVRDESLIENVYRMGAYDYIAKYPRAELVAAARRALEYRRLKLENRAYQAKVGFPA